MLNLVSYGGSETRMWFKPQTSHLEARVSSAQWGRTSGGTWISITADCFTNQDNKTASVLKRALISQNEKMCFAFTRLSCCCSSLILMHMSANRNILSVCKRHLCSDFCSAHFILCSRCHIRVIDTFGTEPAYNHEEYATLHGYRTNWGYWNLHGQQYMTMFRMLVFIFLCIFPRIWTLWWMHVGMCVHKLIKSSTRNRRGFWGGANGAENVTVQQEPYTFGETGGSRNSSCLCSHQLIQWITYCCHRAWHCERRQLSSQVWK